ARQSADGAWTIESLGPFATHPDAPAFEGGSSYATGLATYVLERAGVSPGDKRLARAREWLKSHQDQTTAAWPGVSLNKKYEEGSLESPFMQDAAPAYAILALTEGR